MSRTVSDRLYGHPRLYAAWNGWRWTARFVREGKLLAAVRQAWAAFIEGHDGETCQECGRRYLLWHAADDLYGRVTGRWPKPWDDGSGQSEVASGLFCPACFDRLASARGIALRWYPMVYAAPSPEPEPQEGQGQG